MSASRQRMACEPRLDFDCNVVLVGDHRVGKTAIANRFVNSKFSEVSQR